MEKKDIVTKEIEKRIVSWKDERIKISADKYKNYLHGQQIDYSICDIVIQELLDILRFVEHEKGEVTA